MVNPVVQVVDEADGQIVYTLRISGASFRPKVFRGGAYTLRVGEQPERMQTLKGARSVPAGSKDVLEVRL